MLSGRVVSVAPLDHDVTFSALAFLPIEVLEQPFHHSWIFLCLLQCLFYHLVLLPEAFLLRTCDKGIPNFVSGRFVRILQTVPGGVLS